MKKWPFVLGGCIAAAWAGASCFIFRKVAARSAHNPGDKDESELPPDSLNMRREMEKAVEWLEERGLEEADTVSWDGLRLKGKLLRTREPSDKVILAVHGYRGDWKDLTVFARFYYEQGWNVLFVNDRGHGDSDGNYIGFGWQDKRDVLCWCGFLKKKFGEDVKILLHGWSMGGAIVLMAAAEEDLPEQVKGVISDCAYTSAWEQFTHVARKELPVSPELLMRGVDLAGYAMAGYRLQNCAPAECAGKIRIPTLFVHGTNDDFVPYYMADKLYHACKAPAKKLVCAEGAGHCMSWLEDRENYEDGLKWLMKEALGEG